jgi:hypothetical protein
MSTKSRRDQAKPTAQPVLRPQHTATGMHRGKVTEQGSHVNTVMSVQPAQSAAKTVHMEGATCFANDPTAMGDAVNSRSLDVLKVGARTCDSTWQEWSCIVRLFESTRFAPGCARQLRVQGPMPAISKASETVLCAFWPTACGVAQMVPVDQSSYGMCADVLTTMPQALAIYVQWIMLIVSLPVSRMPWSPQSGATAKHGGLADAWSFIVSGFNFFLAAWLPSTACCKPGTGGRVSRLMTLQAVCCSAQLSGELHR